MRSTHACTPSFACLYPIFTSVVVYSRTTNKKKPNTKTVRRQRHLLNKVFGFWSEAKKKCGAHTHVHHLSRISLQYSRRLLSILAQEKTNRHKNQNSDCVYSSLFLSVPERFIDDINTLCTFFRKEFFDLRKEMLIMFSYASRGCLCLTNITTSFI